MGVLFLLFFKQACFWGYTPFIALAPPHFSTHTLDGKSSTGYACFFFLFWLLLVWLHMKNQVLVNTCSGLLLVSVARTSCLLFKNGNREQSGEVCIPRRKQNSMDIIIIIVTEFFSSLLAS